MSSTKARKIKPSDETRRRARAYDKALQSLAHEYRKEYLAYMADGAWGTTWKQRHNSTRRHLRFQHPRVFRRLYDFFLKMEEV